MVYKTYELCNLELFNPGDVLQDVLKGQSVLVIALTEEIEFNKTDYRFLTSKQVQDIEDFVLLSDRINYLISHAIVNSFYSKLLECDVDSLDYCYTSYNKPYIKNKNNIKFNISHTLGCTVIAFSCIDIGIDIENIEREIDFDTIVNSYFSDFEKNYIDGECIKFFELWVSKEAYLKCVGYGLSKGLERTNINFIGLNYFEIINVDNNQMYTIQIQHIYSRYVVGITTSEVRNG